MKKIEINTESFFVSQRPVSYRKLDEFIKEYDFFVLSISSKILKDISKFTSRSESTFGIQRTHVEERDKQIGQFISSEHPFFPNTIIINIPLEYNEKMYDSKNNTLKFSIPEKSAYVIDGQHRLKAFMSKYSKNVELDMVVVAYFGLELPTIAEIFTRINFYQKPVSKSLVYDLLDLNKDPEFEKYKEAHEIVSRLNEKIGSPFYNMIKMLGVGQGQLSQAAVVEALTTRYKIISLLDGKYDTDKKTKIINNYFSSIKDFYKTSWSSPDSILSRSVGFNALVKILMNIIIKNINFKDLVSFDFDKYIIALGTIDIDSEEIKSFGGFKGVNALAKKFENALVESELL